MVKVADTRPKGVSREEIKEALISEGTVSGAARKVGITRKGMHARMKYLEANDDLPRPRAHANPPRWRPAEEIIAARKAEFERVAAADDGPSIVDLADDGPFCIVFLGDPHLDSPGTDLALWERWINILDYKRGVHGFGLGDWLDNWLRVLGHLYGEAETSAPDGWIMLQHYLDQIGKHLIGSVGGNHDAWSGHSDLLAATMQKHGVTHQNHELNLTLRTPSQREITLGARHNWPGTSIYNPVHGIARAALMGRTETILVGGDKHISGEARVKHPGSKTFTWCAQIASFKIHDGYAVTKGFTDKHASPAVAMVVEPSRPDTDPQLVTTFFDPEAAVDYLASLRRKK